MNDKPKFWLVKDSRGSIQGPLEEILVIRLIKLNRLKDTDFVAEYPAGEWVRLSRIPAFYDVILDVLSGKVRLEETRIKEVKKEDAGELVNENQDVIKEIPVPKNPLGQDSNGQAQENSKEDSIREPGNDGNSIGDSAGNWATGIIPNPITEKKIKKSFVVVEGTSDGVKKHNENIDSTQEESSGFQVSRKSKGKLKEGASGGDFGGGIGGDRGKRSSGKPGGSKGNSDGITIELSDEKVRIRKKKKKASAFPIFFIILAAIAAYFYFEDEGPKGPPKGQIHLLLPRQNQPAAASPTETSDLIRRAIQSFQKDSFSGYYKSENYLVEAVEGDPKNIDAMALLCLTYRELWPFAFQDSSDLQALSRLAQVTAQLDSLGEKGAICRLSQQILAGQYEAVQSKLKSVMQQFPTSAFFYEMKAQLLGDMRDYSTAIAFVQKSQQLQPTWMKPFLLEARFRVKFGQYSEARKLYEEIVTQYPKHGVASVELGRLEFIQFRQEAQGVQRIQAGLKADRLPNFTKSIGFEALALYYEKHQDRKLALENAIAAYKSDPTNINAKQMLTRFGGDASIPEIKTDCQEIIRLGEQYSKTGNHLAAQAEFRTAFDACEPKNATAALRAAQSLAKLNQSQDAIEWAERAILADNRLIEAYVLTAELNAERFDFDKAIAALKLASTVNPQSFEIYRGYALVELKRNNYKDSIRYGEQALKLYDNDIETHLILVRAYQAAKEYRKGYQVAARAIGLDKNNTKAQGLYAEAYAGFQGVSAASDYLRNLINTYPAIADYRLSFARILKMEDKFSDMIEVLNQIVQMDPNSKEARLLLGQSYSGLNKPREALDAYLAAITIDPTDVVPLILIGDLYLLSGDNDNGLESYSRARKINPKYPRVNYLVGRAYFLGREYQKAVDEAQKEKKNNPNLSDSYVLTGEAYLALGLREGEGGKPYFTKAAEEFQRALKLRQQQAPIYILLARAHRLSGNFDIATTMLNQASAKESGNPDIYKERGAIYEKKGQNEQAAAAYRKYLELAPAAPDHSKIQERIRAVGGGI